MGKAIARMSRTKGPRNGKEENERNAKIGHLFPMGVLLWK